MQRTTTITSKRRSTARALYLIAITAAAAIYVPRLAVAGVNTWTPLGPAGGRIADVEFSPSVQGELYLAAMSGFHRSTLAGTSWTLTRENFGSRPIDVAVDPSNADRVLLVTLDGLFLSNDHGATFERRLDAGHAGVAVETSSDGGTMYFASSTRLYRSVDRGDSWTERTPPPFTNDDRGERVRALAVDPTDAAILYVSVLGVGVFSSMNSGDSWQQIGAAIPALAQTLSLDIDPSNRLRLFAATVEGLHLSNDGGVTWSDTSLQTLVSDIDVDPADPNVIFATVLAGQIFKSIDGGATFNPLPITLPVFEGPRIAIDPLQSSNIVAFGDGALMVSTDGGSTWAERTSGIHATTPQSVASLGTRRYFGVAQSGIHFVEAGSTDVVAVDNAELLQLVPDVVHTVQVLALPGPASDMLFARLNDSVIARSTNAGADWTAIWPFPAVSVWHVAASALEPQTIYAGTSEGVYKSLDGGGHWGAANSGLPAGIWVNLIAIAPTPAIVYASVITLPPGVGPSETRLYRSLDAGASWTAISPAHPEGIVSLAVDPRDPQVVYAGRVAGDARVRKTTDGGASWTPAVCCQVLSFAFDPVRPGTLYAGHNGGVIRSVDSGANWESLFQGAPSHYVVDAVALDAAHRHTLLLGVAGFGIRRMTIAPDLELSLTEPASLFLGTSAAYELRVLNRGPFQATNVSVTLTLPASATGLSATAAGASCTVSHTTVTCSYNALGQSTTIGSTATILLHATPSATGAFGVSASIAADEPDAVTGNNSATSMLSAVDAPVAPPPPPPPPPPVTPPTPPPTSPPTTPPTTTPAAPPASTGGGGGGGGGGLGLELVALLSLLVPIRRSVARRP